VASEIEPEIGQLKEAPGAGIVSMGGPTFRQELVRLGLVDEFRLFVRPVLLGGGVSPFPHLDRTRLDLVDSCTLDSTVVHLHYRLGSD